MPALPGPRELSRIQLIRIGGDRVHALPWLLALLIPGIGAPIRAIEPLQPPPWLTTTLLAAGGTLGITEVLASERCITGRTCVEANPLMPRGTGGGASASRILIKSAGTATVAYLVLRHRKRHPWAALAGSVGLVVWNGYLTRRALDHHRPPLPR